MKKVGITGQQGFIGSHLYRALGLLPEEFKIVEFERNNFEDKDKLKKFVEKCDVIVHLAAMNRHENQQKIFDNNVDLVQKLIVALNKKSSSTHVIFSSSTQEEKDNLYGRSKIKGRELLENWVEKNNGFFSPLLIPNVFGPDGKPFYNSFIATFCQQIKNGESPKLIIDSKVNLIYIKDLISEIITIIRKPKEFNKTIRIRPSFKIKVSSVLEKLNKINSKNQNIEKSKINEYLQQTLDSYEKIENQKKIMILGASGMAGHVIYKYLYEKSEFLIRTISFKQKVNKETILLDVRNFQKLENEIDNFKPNIVINCIGILIPGSNEDPSNSILLNSYFPHFLSKLSEKNNYKVIHLSTDCVFSGKSNGGYTETSFKDADDTYGRSKALGEINSQNHLTLRTSIIGPELKKDGLGLLHWFLKQENEVTGFTSAYWSGITTLQLAIVIYDSINNNDISGVHHITNNTKISKFDLLVLFKETWNKTTLVKKAAGKSVDKSFIDTMNVAKIPSYKDMLMELKEFMEVYDKDFNYKKNYSL